MKSFTHYYCYGMRLRPYAPACQPTQGFIAKVDGNAVFEHEEFLPRRYHDILIYNRSLSDSEVRDYELDELGKFDRVNPAPQED